MDANLIPINKFIELAKGQGFDFGRGDPKIHLAYLTKIGTLPPSAKRKINGKITGCYDQDCIQRLLDVEAMKAKGMTYSQIAKTIFYHQSSTLNPYPPSSTFHRLGSNPSILYMVIGILLGFLISTLNSQGLAEMRKYSNVSLTAPPENESVAIGNKSAEISDSVYIITVPKQNLDKLEKTNINTLISN